MKTYVQRFEEEWCKYIGVKYAIAHNSGTSGLHTCLLAAGVGKGDEVIVSALSPIMPAFAVLYCGATPVFADVREATFNIDWTDVDRKVTNKTKAIIGINLYGLPMTDFLPYCIKRIVIEDSAECVLPDMKIRGNMAIFSFERTKHLSTGEGGMAVTNEPELAKWIRKFGGIGYKHLTAELGRTEANPDIFHDPHYKRHDCVGYNYRMSELCAQEGWQFMTTLFLAIRKRQQIAKLYDDAIKDCGWVRPQFIPEGYEHSYFTYAVVLERDDSKWKDFYNKFKELSGDTFYAAWSLPYQEPALAGLTGDCPVAEYLQPRMMQFKTNYKTIKEAEQKADALNKTIRWFE